MPNSNISSIVWKNKEDKEKFSIKEVHNDLRRNTNEVIWEHYIGLHNAFPNTPLLYFVDGYSEQTLNSCQDAEMG